MSDEQRDTPRAEPPAAGAPAHGSRRSVMGAVLASVAVTAVCAGAVVALGDSPAHHHATAVRAAARPSARTLPLGSPPPWPSAVPPAAAPSGAVATAAPTSPAKAAPRPKSPHPKGSPGGTGGTPKHRTTPFPPGGGEHVVPTRDTSDGVATKAPSPPAPSGPVKVGGEVTCTSGRSVEGVWVVATKGSGWAPWQGLGNGSTSRYWYTLPTPESYSLHVGCGGSTSSWAVSTATPTVSGTDNDFTCVDVAGQPGYGTCTRRG